MKKYIIMSAIGLVSIAGLTSCSDFLDTDNKATVTTDDQFSSQAGWNQLMNDAYYRMRSIYNGDPVLLFCAGTDMYTTAQGNSPSVLHTYQFPTDNSVVQDLYQNTYSFINSANGVLKYSSDDQLNDEARFVRAYGYYILTQQYGSVPFITEYIESAETSYPRTDLATIYEGLAEDLQEVIANGNLPQTSAPTDGRGRASIIAVKALLAKIYLAAGWDIQTTLSNAQNGTYSVNSTEYFAKAAALAAEVANAVPLTQTFEQKYNFDTNEAGNNAETLFAIQYDRATSSNQINGGHSQQHIFGGYMGSNTLGLKALQNPLCPTERVYYAFDKNDDRFEGSFMTTIYNYDGNDANWSKQGYWGYYNTTDAEKNNLKIAFKFFPWYATDADIDAYLSAHAAQFVTTGLKNATRVVRVADELKTWNYTSAGALASGSPSTTTFDAAIRGIGNLPPVKKFDDKNTASTVTQSNGDYRDVVLLDASEIYLVAAEAYLMAGDETNALRYLNAVRTRANAGTLGSFNDYQRYDWVNGGYIKVGQTDSYGVTITKLDVILDERMRETLGQYNRWMDLRRTKQLIRYITAYNGLTIANLTGVDGELKWLRPIPSNEIELNSGITYADQNPGYRTSGEEEAEETAEETK